MASRITEAAASSLEGNSTNRAVVDALRILECVAGSDRSLGVVEIAEQLGFSTARTHRLLSTLRDCGYAAQDPSTSKYAIGLQAFALAVLGGLERDIRAIALPHMHRLNQATGETVHLTAYDRGDVVCIEKVDSSQPVVPNTTIGSRAPAFSVAAGKALLAFQPAAELERVLAQPLVRFTDSTPASPEQVLTEMQQIRRDGFAVNREGWRNGVSGVAAPVRDYSGTVRASLANILPSSRLTKRHERLLIRETIESATAISTELGFSAGVGALTRRAEGNPA